MPQRLPRSLIIGLAWLAGLSLFGSVMLEQKHLAYLQNHPITVNLISGVVGFAWGLLTISVGMNWFLARNAAERNRFKNTLAYVVAERAGEIVCAAVPKSYFGTAAAADSERKDARCRDLVEASKELWDLKAEDAEEVLLSKVGSGPLDPADFAAFIVEVEAYLLDHMPVIVPPNLAINPTVNFWRRRAIRELDLLNDIVADASADARRLRVAVLSILSALANIEQVVRDVSRHGDEHLMHNEAVEKRSTETPLAGVPPFVELSALRAKRAKLERGFILDYPTDDE